jgi:hypothetical protein
VIGRRDRPGALVKRDQKPRFGIDLSAGIWDFDVTPTSLRQAGFNPSRFAPSGTRRSAGR